MLSKRTELQTASALALFLSMSAAAQETFNVDDESTQLEEIDESKIPRRIGYKTSDRGFSGPSSVPSQLDEDDILKDPVFRFPKIDHFFHPWLATKKRVNDEHDLQFGFDYTTLSQLLSSSLTDEKFGSSGILRGYGVWGLTRSSDKDWGRLVFKVDHRHTVFADVTPSNLGGEAGYIGQTGTLFTDAGLVLVDLNWQQSFKDGNVGLVVGRFDPNDYLGVLGYANPWTGFSNLSTMLNSSLAYPDASVGIGAGYRLTDQWYVKGSINDANGTVTTTKMFDGGAEFFKWAELGWTPSPDQHYSTNIHVVAWHVDEREKAGIEFGHGIMLGGIMTTYDERWQAFMRLGFSSGAAQIYNETFTLGFARKFRRNADQAGLALNWGDIPGGLGSQVTGEVFYRLQLAQNFAITPSLQLLKDPALNDTYSRIWVYSLRMRLTL